MSKPTAYKVYSAAAQLIAEGKEDMSCIAISVASQRLGGKYNCPERGWYGSMFGPGSKNFIPSAYSYTLAQKRRHPFWDKEGGTNAQKQRRRDNRVMALLSMAQIAKISHF